MWTKHLNVLDHGNNNVRTIKIARLNVSNLGLALGVLAGGGSDIHIKCVHFNSKISLKTIGWISRFGGL